MDLDEGVKRAKFSTAILVTMYGIIETLVRLYFFNIFAFLVVALCYFFLVAYQQQKGMIHVRISLGFLLYSIVSVILFWVGNIPKHDTILLIIITIYLILNFYKCVPSDINYPASGIKDEKWKHTFLSIKIDYISFFLLIFSYLAINIDLFGLSLVFIDIITVMLFNLYLYFKIRPSRIDFEQIKVEALYNKKRDNVFEALMMFAKKCPRVTVREVAEKSGEEIGFTEVITRQLISNKKINAVFDNDSKGIEFNIAAEEIDDLLKACDTWGKEGKGNKI